MLKSDRAGCTYCFQKCVMCMRGQDQNCCQIFMKKTSCQSFVPQAFCFPKCLFVILLTRHKWEMDVAKWEPHSKNSSTIDIY